MTDRELLERYIQGDREAFNELARRHVDMVHAAVRRQAPQSADDVVQAVFLLLAQKAPAISSSVTVAGWLHRAVRYCCSNVNKMEKRRRRHEREAASMATQLEDRSWENLLPMLDQAMSALGATERDAVLLRYLEARSIDQTAQELGISPDAAAKRAGRGLDKLRKYFAKQGYAVPVATIGGLMAAEAAKAAPVGLISLVHAGGSGGSPAVLSLIREARHIMMLAKIKSLALLAVVCVPVSTLAVVVTVKTLAAPARETGSKVLPINMAAASPSTLPATRAASNDTASDEQLAASDHQLTGNETLSIGIMDFTGEGTGITVVRSPIAQDGTISVKSLPPIKVVGLNGRQTATAVQKTLTNGGNPAYLDIYLPIGATILGDAAAVPPDYKIGSGDLLAITIGNLMGDGTGDFKRTVRVSSDGSCDLPFVAPAHASGLITGELEKAINKIYSDARLLRNAPISVKVIETGRR